MPCTYYNAGEEAQIAAAEIRKLKEALDLATRLLCKVVPRLDSEFVSKDAELSKWVREHAVMDAARKQEQKIRRQAVKEQETRDLEKQNKELIRLAKKLGKKLV